MLRAKVIVDGREVASYEFDGTIRSTKIQTASGLELLKSRVMLVIALKEKQRNPSLEEVTITPELMWRYFCE